MKSLSIPIWFISLGLIMANGVCTMAGDAHGPLYTAYNIWKHTDKGMSCVNFKSSADFIPAGTKVKNPRVVNKKVWHGEGKYTLVTAIVFWLADTDEKVSIRFNKNWHPGKTAADYLDVMFTQEDFKRLTKGFSGLEMDGIHRGKLYQGMRKEAVIIAYGYPPENETPDLSSDLWMYWMSAQIIKKICFDEENRAIHCAFRKEL